MNVSVPVSAKCGKCRATLLFPDNAIRRTRIMCSNCGEDCGTYGKIEDAARNSVASKINTILKGKKN